MSGLSIYLTEVRNLSDITTGVTIALYGCSAFIYSILLGSAIDKYGLKICLILGNISALTGFVILLLNSSISIQIVSILTLISAGNSVVLPSLKLGVSHYANENAKSLGFSMFFVVFFISGALAGIIVDIALSLGSTDSATFNKIFMIGISFVIISTALSFLIQDIEKPKENMQTWEITKEVIKTKVFWKFMVLTLLLVIVKTLYSHLTMTLPLYMHRDIGGDAHFGYMLAVHKGIVVIFIPLLTSMVYFFNCYSLLIIGSFISALSVIPLLFGANYYTVIIFIVIVSIGESLYAPRLIDYTLAIAPPGKEGTFVALASSPLALSMIIAGLSGGALLSNFCPSSGERNCWAMWGIIGLMVLVIPIIMIVFRNFLEEMPRKVEDNL
ncbi:hypothetical protein SteCoe_20648 [Stentor coeruleus]|uniref:Major facilitator superfamily (MFS) profile domain-containing protein n=1 Tax=Stentor coeruleus TaxID=5963 RepID=A0A1R2BRZ9_9CILI|nr:hypothetical protein SteCoe_20648 [Stentor coeruleus]